MSELTFELFAITGYATIGAWIAYVWRKRTKNRWKEFERQFKMWLEKNPK